MAKYDFPSYSGTGGEVENSVSDQDQKAVFGQGNKAPVWESGELKFKTGQEYIQLADFEIKYDEREIYAFSSITINIWIKLEQAPNSGVYLIKSELENEIVRI